MRKYPKASCLNCTVFQCAVLIAHNAHTHIHSAKMLDLVQSKPPIISTLNYPTAMATHFLVCQFVALYHAHTSQNHTPATLGIKFGQRAWI